MSSRLSALFSTLLILVNASAVWADKLDTMISPVSNPVLFEDPHITTELRPVFMYHEFRSDFLTQGGNAEYYGLQFRYAVNDRLGLILPKFAVMSVYPGNEEMDQGTGLSNLTAGAKWVFLKDPEFDGIFTGGLRYEFPTGADTVLQGEGSGFLNPFFSGAAKLAPNVNFVAASGVRIRMQSEDSTMWDLDMHIDTQLGSFFPLFELNMTHCIGAGKRYTGGSEGGDLWILGMDGAAGNTLLTGAAGARYKFTNNFSIGAAYQFPITSGAGSDVFRWRLTSDMILTF